MFQFSTPGLELKPVLTKLRCQRKTNKRHIRKFVSRTYSAEIELSGMGFSSLYQGKQIYVLFIQMKSYYAIAEPTTESGDFSLIPN